MYIRKNIADFLKKMPKEMKLPKNWKKFVKENDVEYNLLIKQGKECKCTNCGKHFYSNQVVIKECSAVCPFCNNIYNIKRSNLRNYFFLYELALVDKIDNKLVLRYFEVRRKYNHEKRKFDDDIVEYARIVPELDIELVNDRFIKYMSIEKVNHTKKIKKWRVFNGMYGLRQYYKSIYLENIEEKLKGTIYQYAPITDAVIYLGNNKLCFLNVLEKSKYPSFELLMKLGLYKLALDCPEKFNITGNFEKRFGVKKNFYNFMKRHDISYDELCVLQLTQKANINKIRRLLRISSNFISDLKEVSKYIDLNQIENYSKKQKNFNIHNYLDYVKNLEKLEIPITNKLLLPDNFNEAHDTSVKKVEIIVDDKELMNEKIKERYKQLEKNGYSDNVFFIRPAKSLDDIKSEACQQNNCVYKNYSIPYAFGECDIYFLREIKNPKKSLVTIEVRDNKIRQKEQKNHINLSEEQNGILNYWEKNIIRKLA